MIAAQRIYRTVDGDIVDEGDVRAAFLVAPEGDEVPVEYRDAVTEFLGGVVEADDAADETESAAIPAIPSRRDPVATWQDYAHIVGIDPEGLTKAQLIDAIEAL